MQPRRILLPLAAIICAASARAADLSGTSDASIRQVLLAVTRHQLRPLADGQYAPAVSVTATEAAIAPQGIAWNYPWGVTLYGVIRSTDVTNDRTARDFVIHHNQIVAREYQWIEDRAGNAGSDPQIDAFLRSDRDPVRGLVVLGNLDNCGAMGVEFLETMLRYPEQSTSAEQKVAERIADWIAEKQDRLPDGTFWRPNAADDTHQWPVGTVWADDLYMSCPFLVRWSAYTHNGKFLTDAAHQILGMSARLQDRDGLWFHAYNVPRHEHAPFKWGRANGWAMVATAEVLSAMSVDHPDRPRLLEVFRRHVNGALQVQSPSGKWHQVLDHPESWEETSSTAMFAYAIARGVNRGWLPAENLAAARKAFAAICSRDVTPEGGVNGTCEGTGIGLTLDFYLNRRRPNDDLHGRGVVLLAGTELLASGHPIACGNSN